MWARYARSNRFIEWVQSTPQIPKAYHNGVLWGGAGTSLYKSTDHWMTLELVHSFPAGSTFRNLLIVKDDIMIAGIDNSIMRTTDGGTTFQTVLTAMHEGSTFGLRSLARQIDGVLYAATYGDKTPSNTEVFRSEDDGATWVKVLDLLDAFPEAINPTGAHIHGIHSDPHTSDLWLLVGDRPNSSIFRCPGGLDVSKPSNWQLLSHATLAPVEFEGYPGHVAHQPIDAWFDEEYAYFSNDQAPWAVKRYHKGSGVWDLALDYADYGMPNMLSGAYGLSMFAEAGNWVYHGSRSNHPENPSHLWRMHKATKEWQHLWSGLPSPVSGSHGFSRIVEAGDYLMVIYQYAGSLYVGKLNPNHPDLA